MMRKGWRKQQVCDAAHHLEMIWTIRPQPTARQQRGYATGIKVIRPEA